MEGSSSSRCLGTNGLALSFPVGPRPRGTRFAGGKLRAQRRLSFSSSSSATRCSRAFERVKDVKNNGAGRREGGTGSIKKVSEQYATGQCAPVNGQRVLHGKRAGRLVHGLVGGYRSSYGLSLKT